MKITDAAHLSNTELTAELSRLAGSERIATAALIVHLGEFDARRMYEGDGFPSMFQYCRAILRLSEDAAYNRIEAARAARRYPAILDMLSAGTLSLTTARMMARHLTPENHPALLAAAAGMGKQEVEDLLARTAPQPDVRALVRKVPGLPPVSPPLVGSLDAGRSGPTLPAAAESGAVPVAVPSLLTTATTPSTPPPGAPRQCVRPLAPERYEIRFTASGAMRERLRMAQDLLGHAVPTGDIAEVFDRALTLLVDHLTRKKFAATSRPRSTRGPAEGSPHIPAEVRRAVWLRDGGACAFVAPRGRRCGARRFLEFHHVRPRAMGGPPTVENIQLRCRSHNGYEVDLFFGPGVRHSRDGIVYGRRAQKAGGPGTRPGTTSPLPSG